MFIPDHGDLMDAEKWDFPEDNIPVYWIGKYPYKAYSRESAQKLAMIRNKIDKLCHNLVINRSGPRGWENSTANEQYLNGVDLFLSLHQETYHDPYLLPSPFFEIAERGLPTSKYLLSEIPRGTKFAGLNKPKQRYIDNTLPSIGKDKNGRALYRDIFLDLNRSEKSLKNLIIHELSHSMANHIGYRPDDHHADFLWAEKLITKYWQNEIF